MKISEEMTPFEFLCNESWECEDLQDKIPNEKCTDFNDYVEQVFDGQTPTKTELNDFLRFNTDEIFEVLGIDND